MLSYDADEALYLYCESHYPVTGAQAKGWDQMLRYS